MFQQNYKRCPIIATDFIEKSWKMFHPLDSLSLTQEHLPGILPGGELRLDAPYKIRASSVIEDTVR